jgi:hypothetical protein
MMIGFMCNQSILQKSHPDKAATHHKTRTFDIMMNSNDMGLPCRLSHKFSIGKGYGAGLGYCRRRCRGVLARVWK